MINDTTTTKLVIFICLFACAFCVGEWKEISVDSDEVHKATFFAVKQLSSRLNSPYHSKLAEIHHSEKQIVAGVNYRLTLSVGYTQCKKSSIPYEKIDDCEFQEGSKRQCRVVVYRNLKQEYRVINFNCAVNEAPVKNDHYTHATRQHFKDFVLRYKKSYKDEEEKELRFKNFQQNLEKIKSLNQHERGTARYGITQFADLTEDEIRKHALGFHANFYYANDLRKQAEIPKISIPDSVDWREQKVVTEVKNQQACGSCWAFSTVGNIEGQWAIKKKKLVSLSVQELVDCDKVDKGCMGGLPSDAYKEIIRIGGLESENDYPYTAKRGECKFSKEKVIAYINDSAIISKNETEIAQWLVKNGPISAGINANAMIFYHSGISHPVDFLCDPGSLNHGVLIVGYGAYFHPIHKKTLPFWIVKNSWGESWGEQGYYRVYRGDGTCGLNIMASSAIVD